MNNNIEVEETRGAKRKYDFSDLQLGVAKAFPATPKYIHKGKVKPSFGVGLYNACNYYIQLEGLGWKVVRRTKGLVVYIIRVA